MAVQIQVDRWRARLDDRGRWKASDARLQEFLDWFTPTLPTPMRGVPDRDLWEAEQVIEVIGGEVVHAGEWEWCEASFTDSWKAYSSVWLPLRVGRVRSSSGQRRCSASRR
jgi:hypothetical protein